MGVAPPVVLAIQSRPGPGAPGVCECGVVPGADGAGPRDHGVAHALGHPAAAHPHGGAHVGGAHRAHRGHGGPHPVVGRVQRLHWRPATCQGWRLRTLYIVYRYPIRLEYEILIVSIYSLL